MTTPNSTTSTVQRLHQLAEAGRLAGTPGRTRHLSLGTGILGDLGQWVTEHHAGATDLVVCDGPTFAAAGQAVEAALRAAGRAPRRLVLEPQHGHDELVCEDGVIEAVRTLLTASDRLNPIAVGAGTVNDIVKSASTQVGRPYQVVPTAASMNGYTSNIAAVLSRGVKRTLSAQQPEAVFADVDVYRTAPTHLTLAGFGDLLSKPYSNADWVLSSLVRDVPYLNEPAELLDAAFPRLLASAHPIGQGQPEGLTILMECILLSGFSMAMAGSSAPASGSEHLVSHYWDMEQHCQGGHLLALHGTQVGIATRLSALLFERLVALPAEAIDPSGLAARRATPAWIEALDVLHPGMTPPVREEIKQQLRGKQKHGAELEAELGDVKARWGEITGRLRQVLMPSQRITQALEEAGCPTRASQIGVDRGRLEHTLIVCRHIRNRYVAFDLMDDLGLLEGWAGQVAAETEGGRA